MQNYFIHIMIWGISIVISSILALYQKDSGCNIAIVWSMCAIYFVLYYLTRFVKFAKVEKKNMVVSETGIFSGRAFGIFVNMYVLQYVLELYKHILLCIILSFCSVIVLVLLRKNIKGFFEKNEWNSLYYEIYISFNVLLSSIASFIGYYNKDFLMVDIDYVGITAKILLIIIYIIVTVISVMPNSFIMRVATINDELK